VIVALISSILGFVSGFGPKVLEVYGKRLDHKQELDIRKMEMEFQKLNHELTLERIKAEAGVKLDESYLEAVAADAVAARDQLKAMIVDAFKPTGIAWVDTFNAIVRPVTAALFLLMFAGGVVAYMLGTTTLNPEFGTVLGTTFVECVQGALGFIFGYRSAIKQPGAK